jgi:lactate permease
LILTTILPLFWLGYALISKIVKPYVACLISLVITSLGAIFVWKMQCNIFLWSIIDGIIFSFCPILWTIFSALFTYRLICEVGAIEGIKKSLSLIAKDLLIQALVVALCFGSLLEGLAGFGTSVIVPSAILVSLGFSLYQSALIPLISNTVPVVYAAVGVPIIALARVTNLPLGILTRMIAIQLLPVTVIIPFLIKRELKIQGKFLVILGSGIVFALSQTLIAWYIGPELPAILAPFATILFLIFYSRLNKEKTEKSDLVFDPKDLLSWIPYVLIVVFILITRFSPKITTILTKFPFSINYPIEVLEKTIKIDFIYTPGTIILISSIIGGLVLRAKFSDFKRAFIGTILQMIPTILIMVSMVVMSNITGYSGMTKFLSNILVYTFGRFFPFISPLLGALGTFLGGSDTTSNVLFGNLQVEAARSIKVSELWLASANATGATGGKLVSLQNLTLAASGIGKSGEEGTLMRFILPYFIFYLLVMGLTIFIGSML